MSLCTCRSPFHPQDSYLMWGFQSTAMSCFLITGNAFTSDHQIPMPPVPIYNWLAPLTVQHCPSPSVNPATSHKLPPPPLNQSPRLRQLPPHRLNQQPQQHLSQKQPPLNQVCIHHFRYFCGKTVNDLKILSLKY